MPSAVKRNELELHITTELKLTKVMNEKIWMQNNKDYNLHKILKYTK